MKFKTPLIEATLLKRSFRFLMEVALENRRKRMLYCPNLGALTHCDILGTRLWFSSANRLSQGYLDVVELMEVNGGWLVALNANYALPLVREGIQSGVIPELGEYRFLQVNNLSASQPIELLLKENGEQCFINIEPVYYADDRGQALFPESGGHSLAALQELIMHRELGMRAILFFCIQHSGVTSMKFSETTHPVYIKMLKMAIKAGVEVLAYRSNINFQELMLASKIPVSMSEDLLFR